MLSRDKSAFPSPSHRHGTPQPPQTRLVSRWGEWRLKNDGLFPAILWGRVCATISMWECRHWTGALATSKEECNLSARFMRNFIQDGPLQRGGCCVVSRDGLRYQPQERRRGTPKRPTLFGVDSGSAGSLASVRQTKLQTRSKSNSRGLAEM